MAGHTLKVKYGVVDDEGNVIRWMCYKPQHDSYIIVKLPRKKRKVEIDWDNIEEALL